MRIRCCRSSRSWEEESLAIQREVDRLVREEEGYEAGSITRRKMRLYPTSDELAASICHAVSRRLAALRQVADAEGYRPALDDAYARLTKSAVPAVRDQASAMLIAKPCRKNGMRTPSVSWTASPTARWIEEERQAILYAREGRDGDAARIGRPRDSHRRRFDGGDCRVDRNCLEGWPAKMMRSNAHCAQLAFEALGQPVWMGLMPRLAAVTVAGDADEAIELLDAVMASLHQE